VAKARILCLHGYAQNADFFRSRTGALRKGLRSLAEFHFIDAPHPATAEFLGDVPEERGAALGWFNVGETTPGARPAISAQYVGVDDSLQTIRQAVEDAGPFDAILGFSQGATLAAFCCLRPEAWWHDDGAPFKFAIMFSAFLPRDPAYSFEVGSSSTPTFHVYGLNDPSVPPASSLAVAACFAHPRTHAHDGGHGVPSDAVLPNALKEFVASSRGGEGCGGGGGDGGGGGGSCGGGGGSGDKRSDRIGSGAGGDGGGGGGGDGSGPQAVGAWAAEDAARFTSAYTIWSQLR